MTKILNVFGVEWMSETKVVPGRLGRGRGVLTWNNHSKKKKSLANYERMGKAWCNGVIFQFLMCLGNHRL